jgi:hypothetical protein
MPDRLHILSEGSQPTSDLLEFVRIFKLRTAFAFKKTCGARLWEISNYDHILRHADCLGDVACYIWASPVRKNLCLCRQAFPFSGSQTRVDAMRQICLFLVSSMEAEIASLKTGHYKIFISVLNIGH